MAVVSHRRKMAIGEGHPKTLFWQAAPQSHSPQAAEVKGKWRNRFLQFECAQALRGHAHTQAVQTLYVKVYRLGANKRCKSFTCTALRSAKSATWSSPTLPTLKYCASGWAR